MLDLKEIPILRCTCCGMAAAPPAGNEGDGVCGVCGAAATSSPMALATTVGR